MCVSGNIEAYNSSWQDPDARLRDIAGQAAARGDRATMAEIRIAQRLKKQPDDRDRTATGSPGYKDLNPQGKRFIDGRDGTEEANASRGGKSTILGGRGSGSAAVSKATVLG